MAEGLGQYHPGLARWKKMTGAGAGGPTRPKGGWKKAHKRSVMGMLKQHQTDPASRQKTSEQALQTDRAKVEAAQQSRATAEQLATSGLSSTPLHAGQMAKAAHEMGRAGEATAAATEQAQTLARLNAARARRGQLMAMMAAERGASAKKRAAALEAAAQVASTTAKAVGDEYGRQKE